MTANVQFCDAADVTNLLQSYSHYVEPQLILH